MRRFISLGIPSVMPDQVFANGATLGSAPGDIKFPKWAQLATYSGIWHVNCLLPIPCNQTSDEFRGSTLITWRWRHIKHANTIAS